MVRHFMPFQPELAWQSYHDIADIRVAMREDLALGLLDADQARPFARRPLESLYDLETDPWEVRNLADDARYATVLDDLRVELSRHVVEGRDVMFCSERELARVSRHTTPYEHHPGARPLRRPAE